MNPTWLFHLVLFFHLLGAFSLVSGTVVAGVAFEAARRRQHAAEIAALLGLARVGALFVAAGIVFVGAFGLWLVDLDHVGYGSTWVEAAIGLLAVVIILGALGGQRPKRARQLASQLAAGGEPPSAELRALLDNRVAVALNYLAAALLVAIIILMVFKPGAR